MDMFELQEIKTALLDEIQNAFKDKKNPMLAEYEEQTQNLLALAKVMTNEKDLMPQENFDLVMEQDYVILQLERWIEDNQKIISQWNNNEESLRKH